MSSTNLVTDNQEQNVSVATLKKEVAQTVKNLTNTTPKAQNLKKQAKNKELTKAAKKV